MLRAFTDERVSARENRDAHNASPTFGVVVVGGSVAALESVLALRDLAGERVALQLIAPRRSSSTAP